MSKIFKNEYFISSSNGIINDTILSSNGIINGTILSSLSSLKIVIGFSFSSSFLPPINLFIW